MHQFGRLERNLKRAPAERMPQAPTRTKQNNPRSRASFRASHGSSSSGRARVEAGARPQLAMMIFDNDVLQVESCGNQASWVLDRRP